MHLTRLLIHAPLFLQADMHRCAAKCCDSNDMSIERVHQCVENCSFPLNGAQKYVQQEFEHLQVS
jgi:hypothetical protein